MIFRFDSLARPSRAAKAIRDAFSTRGIDLGLCGAQAVAARAYGYADYRDLQRSVGRYPATPWDTLGEEYASRMHQHAEAFEEAGLTNADASDLAVALGLTSKRFPRLGRRLTGIGSFGRRSASPPSGDTLVSLGLTREQASHLRSARRDRAGIFIVAGPGPGRCDMLVDALLREPGPRPLGGCMRRSGHRTHTLDQAFEASRSAGFRNTAVDFGHEISLWRDGRLLDVVEGGGQAWVTLRPDNVFSAIRHFQESMDGRRGVGNEHRSWEQADVIRAQSRMACAVSFIPTRTVCRHCGLARPVVTARDADKEQSLLEFEAEAGFALPSSARFANKDGCEGCDLGMEARSVAATVVVADDVINRLLLKREEEAPNFIARDAYDVWRERGGVDAHDVSLARIFGGLMDPSCESCLHGAYFGPSDIETALAVARSECLDVSLDPERA